jgi:hypothetical protein
LAISASAAPAETIRTVALSGQPAPGAPSGVNYLFFSPFSLALNDAGQTVYVAFLAGSGVDLTNDASVWSEGSGSLRLVAREGSPAPGTPSGVNFQSFGRTVLNDAGQTAFNAQLTGGGLNFAEGIWSERSGSFRLVAREGSPTPNLPGVNFISIGSVVLNNAGQTAFPADITGNIGFSGSIWSEGSGSLRLVARDGIRAPGMPSGVNYFGLVSLNLNNAGQSNFYSLLIGTGVDSTNDESIWLSNSGSLALVAREGSQAAGLPSGVNYGALGAPALNNAGQTAFWARLGDGGGDFAEGIWSEGSGTLMLVARSEDQAPGAPSGVNFREFHSRPMLNDAGQTAFWASLSGSGVDASNDVGIWLEGAGRRALVMREGTQAPGTPNGVNFGGLILSISYFPPALNDAGQIAFISSLAGSGVTSTNRQGIWATDRLGDLQLIARTGDLLEVAPGDFRMIRDLVFDSSRGFNKLGQLLFWASFTDASEGIFISNLVAIPEPASLLLVVSAVPAASAFRRRGRDKGDILLSITK